MGESTAMKDNMFRIAIFAAVLATALTAQAAEPLDWSGKQQKFLNQALETMKTRKYSTAGDLLPAARRKKAHESARKFSEALDGLANALGEKKMREVAPHEGRDIKAKLAVIAWNRKKFSQNYELIEKKYMKGVHHPDSIFPHSPSPEPEHVSEAYRLAWEYFLLSPEPEGESPLYRMTVLEALSRVRSEATLPVFIETYRQSAVPEVSIEEAAGEQRQILSALGWFSTTEGLKAILECLTLSLEQQKQIPELKQKWNAQDFALRILTDQEHLGNGEEWKRTLAGFPLEGLQAGQRLLIEQAKIKTIRTGSKKKLSND